MEYLGIAGLDIAWLFIGIFVVLLILLVLIIVQFAKYKKLKKKYDKFMKGKDGKSLEKDIIALFEDNKFIKSESEKNRKDIRNILKKLEFCYQKAGLVKYDAYNQMGGNLSFCLCMLNERNSGFILNVGSAAGFLAGPTFASYYASKNYVVRLTQAIHEEMRRDNKNVKVSVLCPLSLIHI